VGAENAIHPAHATTRYSWMRLPTRSVVRTWAGSVSSIGAGGESSADGARVTPHISEKGASQTAG
jgi:hypothetical protein